MSEQVMRDPISDVTNETIKEIILDKSDFPGVIGAAATGTVYGLTQSEIAAIMTIMIGISVIAHKIVLIWIALKEHKLKTFKKKKG